ncbi:MAG: Holliday junction resolvase RuvX, partial [Nitrosomonadales bacterium]|nr:Holliday junction resolvase RuvX [Nitrosomonadales bacterium]
SVYFVDERFSSSEAELKLKKLEKNLKKRKHIIDQVAAMIILDSFFEADKDDRKLVL